MCKVCIVEDDTTLRNELARLLVLQGYECVACTDFANAAQWLITEDPDCSIVDLRLPGADGLSICEEFRRVCNTPLLVLTGSTTEFDEVMAMGLGADDYLRKPYRPAVLLAHIQALLRRSGGNVRTLSHRGVVLDMSRGIVFFEGASAEVTRNEQKMLGVLMQNPGQVVTRQELMCELWDTDSFIDDNTLTVNVNRVRKVLADIGAPSDFLLTKRGQGYLV